VASQGFAWAGQQGVAAHERRDHASLAQRGDRSVDQRVHRGLARSGAERGRIAVRRGHVEAEPRHRPQHEWQERDFPRAASQQTERLTLEPLGLERGVAGQVVDVVVELVERGLPARVSGIEPADLHTSTVPHGLGLFAKDHPRAAMHEARSRSSAVMRRFSHEDRDRDREYERGPGQAWPPPGVGSLGPYRERSGRSHSGDDDEPPTGGSLLRPLLGLVEVLRRRWRIAVATTSLALVVGVLLLAVLPEQWRAETTLIVHPSGLEVLDEVEGLEPTLDSNGYRAYYRTQREIASSRTVAAEALRRLNLADNPVFLGVDHIRDPIAQAEAAAGIDPVERLRERVRVHEIPESQVMMIRAEYPDPVIAAELANALADAYLDHVSGEREDKGNQAEVDVDVERKRAREQLRTAEGALDDFKAEHEITTIALEDRQSIVTQTIIDLSTRTTGARATRLEAQHLRDEARKLHRSGALVGAAALLSVGERVIFDQLLVTRVEAESEFSDLDLQYGPKHPQWRKAKTRLELVETAIATEAKGQLASLAARYEAARATELDLAAALEDERKRALELSRLEPDYRELERDVHDAATTYDVLSRRNTELGLTNRVESRPPVELIDPAVEPREPVRPRAWLVMAAALLLGLGGSALLAVIVDLRDSTIRDLGDLERAARDWDLPVLGQLPKITLDPALGTGNLRAQRRRRDLHAHLFPQSIMAERIRSVRASIGFALGELSSCPALLVTSPSSAEGKSSTALNLALSFAHAGKRVALIDADMRRPRLHEAVAMPVDREDLGLAAILASRCELDDALYGGEGSGLPAELRLLACGPLTDTPAEWLDSSAFRRLLAELRERFDVVIIDSPPVLPVVDALLLARVVDGVVLVARCRSSSRLDVQRALSLLRQRDTHLLGLVLNEVDVRRDLDKYAGEYYRVRDTGERANTQD
jgi:succinoglycan biosynthesis transport protein ExoP